MQRADKNNVSNLYYGERECFHNTYDVYNEKGEDGELEI